MLYHKYSNSSVLPSAGDWTQDSLYARQVLYNFHYTFVLIWLSFYICICEWAHYQFSSPGLKGTGADKRCLASLVQDIVIKLHFTFSCRFRNITKEKKNWVDWTEAVLDWRISLYWWTVKESSQFPTASAVATITVCWYQRVSLQTETYSVHCYPSQRLLSWVSQNECTST